MARLKPLQPEFAGLIEQWYQPPVGLILNENAAVQWGEGEEIDANEVPALAYGFEPASVSRLQELAARGIQVHCIYPNLPAGALGAERNASGRLDTHTWSSLLLDDENDWQACAQTALGLSLGLADELQAPWVVLAPSSKHWRTYRHVDRAEMRATLAPAVHSVRPAYAFLFADAVSYSSLSASDTQRYWTRLLPRTAAAVLQRHAEDIILKKTWGDAVHAVFTSASAAALAALQIQEAAAGLSEELSGGRRLSFRIAVHFGAADQGMDPVERLPSVFGPQLSLAARIEPVAPPGSVFVTEAFAARLSLDDAHAVRCTYVGTTRLAKSYANLRLLRLAYVPASHNDQRS
jgi:class 3 adenylate cyclase